MPTYEFKCEECGSVTEEVFSMKDCPGLISCRCGGRSHKQMVLNSAVHLKGTCWGRDKYTASGNLKWIGDKKKED